MISQEDLEFRQLLGRNIKTVLKSRGLAVKGLAAYLGISEQAMHKRLNGKAPMPTEDVRKIATFADLDDFGILFRASLIDLRGQQARCLPAFAGQQLSFDDLPQVVVQLRELIAA